jgi:hypothetical protein
MPQVSIALPFPVEDLFALRLFLEELVCNVCRFVHVAEQGISPQELWIRQEVSLGIPNTFSDILIRVPNHLADGHVRREMSPFFNMASDDRWADGRISGIKIIRIDANNSEKMRAKTRSELLQG